MENIEQVITEQEAKFCLLYINAPAPFGGDAAKCYQAIFGEHIDDTEARYSALKLMNKECVKERMEELNQLNLVDSAALKNKITKTLVKIMDECAEGEYVDRFGKTLSPAAMRSVSVNAAKTLNDMYGIKEDIAHTVNLNSENSGGIVFNINVPKQTNEEEEFK